MRKDNLFPLFIASSLLFFPLMVTSQSSAELIRQWPFDEGNRKIAKDGSGKGNDGKFLGKLKWAKGKFGTALEFDGEGAAVVTKPGIFAKNFTVVFWAYSAIAWGEKRCNLSHFRDVIGLRRGCLKALS